LEWGSGSLVVEKQQENPIKSPDFSWHYSFVNKGVFGREKSFEKDEVGTD